MSEGLKPKVLVVGLDGATFDLIGPWVAEGRLPTLGRLMREGVYGELQSTFPPMTGPAWTSFATGVNPGKHGLYDWIAREPDSYRFGPVTALDAKVPTLYSLLSAAGRRVCVFNVPMTYPPIAVNGVMVSGMPTPNTNVTFTSPAGLFPQILAAVDDYILYPDPGQAYSDSGVEAFLQRLYRCTELRLKTLAYLRQLEAWDFCMVVFNGTDTISHALWKYGDPSHPLHDPGRYAKYGRAILDYYSYLDQQLQPIVASLDGNTTLILMSDHGFGPFHKFIHVNNWLIQQKMMHIRPGLIPRLKQTAFQLGFAPMNVYNAFMKLGLGALKREVVRGQGQGLLKTLFLSFEDVDWRRTLAYSLGNIGQIYVNLSGREPFGAVKPGREYEQVRDDIMGQLLELRDPANGEQVVEAVYRREELYHGPQLERAADILFMPRRLEYFGFGEYEFGSHKIIEAMKRGISGTHRMNGIFIAYGAAIRPDSTPNQARLIDLAPTIHYLLGVPIPAGMDGRVLDEIIQPGNRPEAIISHDNHWQQPNSLETPLNEAERETLTNRLRSLGYVG